MRKWLQRQPGLLLLDPLMLLVTRDGEEYMEKHLQRTLRGDLFFQKGGGG